MVTQSFSTRRGKRKIPHTLPAGKARNAATVLFVTVVFLAWTATAGDGGPGDPEGKSPSHWAFVKPRRPDLPKVHAPSWTRNPIDAFVLAILEQRGLHPSPEADPYTLLRRVHLDLTGLPPSPDEIDAFINDPKHNAYERAVDRLLASPHYGERQALWWLDAARYADTNGYEKDRHRSMWPYRDWVINAFNDDKPFNTFVIEQLAGDMLPRANQAQFVATGFHRNTLLNEEGGIDVEEFRYEAVIDRTNTTATVFMGLTMACAQCHDHKFDPISQKEYFQFMAFLNNTDDENIALYDGEIAKKRSAALAEIDAVEADLENRFPIQDREGDSSDHTLTDEDRRALLVEEKFSAWLKDVTPKATRWTILKPLSVASKNHVSFVSLDDGSILARGDNPNKDTYEVSFLTRMENITAIRIEALPHESLPGHGPGRGTVLAEGDFFLSEIQVETAQGNGAEEPKSVALQNPSHDYAAKDRGAALALDGKLDTGWSIKGREGRAHAAVFEFARPVSLTTDTVLNVRLIQQFIHNHILGRFRISVTQDPLPVRAVQGNAQIENILLVPRPMRTRAQRDELKRFYLSIAPELKEVRNEIQKKRDDIASFSEGHVLTKRVDARMTRLHHRGEFLQPRETVQADVPAVLPPFPKRGRRDRLALAKWIVSPKHPLTSRVIVNRLWQNTFGRGIVLTSDDFGLQGEAPTHPELLDWLATEFVRRRWSVKAALRLMVTSATYRQASASTPQLLAADPYNQWLARGPRFRIDAELIRDAALAASGLLSKQIGGPSVFPPLPEGLMSFVYAGSKWGKSDGQDRYRRGLYTYIKRTLPYPSATVFDAPNRDITCSRRVRSNTPLQALTLLNDEVFVEASQAMAARILKEETRGLDEKTRYAYLLALSRPPDDIELARIKTFYEKQLQRFRAGEPHPALITTTQEDDDRQKDSLAAWALVCRVLLNLDEAITKG